MWTSKETARIFGGLMVGAMLACAGQAQTGDVSASTPMSAIDWLSAQTAIPAAQPLNEPPTTKSGTAPAVTVAPLGRPVTHRLGLLPFSVTGLQPTLWADSGTDDLVRGVRTAQSQSLPAANELLLTLLLAEADARQDDPASLRWLGARVDSLVHLGAVEPALVLIAQGMPDKNPALMSRWMTLGLLTGTEGSVCAAALEAPHMLRDEAARIYCTARRGDVDTASLLFGTAAALGVLSPVKEALLARFLDPDLFADTPMPRAPVRPDALTFRLFEAAGEPLPTAPLPRAYSHVDLRQEAGWKAQLEAAERLARTGVLPSNQLLGLYSERKAAASGGIWDRVSALQKFETALGGRDTERLIKTLPAMWRGMQAAGLEVAFSDLFAEDLGKMTLTGAAADIAFRMTLLSRRYEAATAPSPASDTDQFLASVAAGVPDATKAKTPVARSVAGAFGGAVPVSATIEDLTPGTLGAVLLRVLDLAADAGRGDAAALGQVIADLRGLGLEDIARRMALQMLILKDRA